MFLPPCRSTRLTVTAMCGDLDPFILTMVRDTSLRDIALCLNVDLNLTQAMILVRYFTDKGCASGNFRGEVLAGGHPLRPVMLGAFNRG